MRLTLIAAVPPAAVRWDQTAPLCPPWPPRRKPGRRSASPSRACAPSSPCCRTKRLSRYGGQSFSSPPAALPRPSRRRSGCLMSVAVLLWTSSGQTGGGRRGGEAESLPGFAAVVQSKSLQLFCCVGVCVFFLFGQVRLV